MSDDEREGLPSASNWHRYEKCAGSYQLSLEAARLAQAAYQEPSRASQRGDRLHAALADFDVELSQADLTSLEFLRLRADEQVKRLFGEEPVTVLNEQRLWLELDGRKAASGRFDRVVYNNRLALVIDFKSGYKEPDPAQTNAQLKFLSVVVAIHLPQITEVVAQIISSAYGVSETRFTIKDLSANYHDIVATLGAINDPHAAFAPSPQACRFCPAVNICQATKNLIAPIAKLNCSALPTGNRAAKLLDECELLSRHIEQIQAYYRRAIEADPAAVPGYGLEVGPPRRHVADWPAARVKLEQFVDSKALESLASFSIPAVEKLLGASIGVKGARLKEHFASILGDLLEQKYPAPTLKRVKGAPAIKALCP